MARRPILDAVTLALADARYEGRLTACLVLAVAAVLTPLLILFGLKFGFVDTLAQRLIQDPRNREISPMGSGRFDDRFFTELAALPDVAFVVPNTRSLAASFSGLENAETGQRVTGVAMIPSGAGDPLLPAGGPAPVGPTEVALSAPLAEALGAVPGTRLDARITRRRGDRAEAARVALTVVSIASPVALGTEAAFVPLELLVATEDYRDGLAVPLLAAEGEPPAEGGRRFARFRLYAHSIDAVRPLHEALAAAGVETRTAVDAIERMRQLDRNLTLVFWIIAGSGGVGAFAALAANLLATVERKRRDLAILRLIGFPTRTIVGFAGAHAMLTAAGGTLIAVAGAAALAIVLNRLFADALGPGEAICRLEPAHYVAAAALTVAGAALAAAWAAVRAARVDPATSLRDV